MLRRSPRAALCWAAALATALATSVLVAGDLAALHRRARHDDRPLPTVVAGRDLPLGAEVTAADLRVVGLPGRGRPGGALADAAAAAGRVVRTPVLAGTPVLDRHLAPAGRTGAEAAVPVGMRLMHVVVDGGLRPRPGATADVLVTFDPSTVPADVDPTLVVARGALVVTAGPADDGNLAAGRTGGDTGVALLVTAEEAPRLAFAAATGVVTLALTPPEEACCRPTTTTAP